MSIIGSIYVSVEAVFGGTFSGPDEAGEKLYNCVQQSGFTANSKVHAIGDGAQWIAEQVSQQFGTKGGYLIDFYHLCDYLSAAAKIIFKDNSVKWLEEQKFNMKNNEISKVIAALLPYIEPSETLDKDAPVRACHRYITNRPGQFKYKC